MLDPAARRLVLAGVLRLHLARRLPARVPADADDDALRAAATRLSGEVGGLEGLHRVRFAPAYPGDGEVEPVRHGRRLVLTTTASGTGPDDGPGALAVVVTVLIPGRVPQVSVAPPPDRR